MFFGVLAAVSFSQSGGHVLTDHEGACWDSSWATWPRPVDSGVVAYRERWADFCGC